jgi:hypothetical protein
VQSAGQGAAAEEAAYGDEDAAAQQAAQPAPAAAAAAADAVHPQQTAAPPAALCDSVAAAIADGGAAAHAGQQCGEEGAASLSPLGPPPLDRVPAEAIALAAGELSLRVEEERRRRMVSFVAVGALPGAGACRSIAYGLWLLVIVPCNKSGFFFGMLFRLHCAGLKC